MAEKMKVIIMGAAGRDFHNFNTFFRNNEKYEVVAFTAAQIPDIAGRRYPPELSGKLYPNGIPIRPEEKLTELIKKNEIDLVNLAYSDLPYHRVGHKFSEVNAAGANFILLSPEDTMIESKKPVIAITAVRTGCGKSQTTRFVANILKKTKKKVVVVRHPMPYGDLRKQIWQRYEIDKDLDKYDCTIEEREEYEPLISMGVIVYAGVDYAEILRRVEREADIIIWDGGNNDFPFYKPDIYITITDPFRPGHEKGYYPGEINVRMSDIVIVNKTNTAEPENVEKVRQSVREMRPKVEIINSRSDVTVDKPELIEGKKVLVVEDGPTLTHGGMEFGAGTIAAKRYKCDIINPKKYATGSLKKMYENYPHVGKVLPAMGYYPEQIREMEIMIEKTPCDVVIAGTPIDLRKVLDSKKPIVRIRYDFKEPTKKFEELILAFAKKGKKKKAI